MAEFVKRYITNDEFTRYGTIMFISTITAGILNYIYQIYMGRVLGPEDYGIFGAIFAIFYMIHVVSQTLSTSAARFVSKFVGEGKQIGFFIKGSMRYTIILGFVFSIIFIILSKKLMLLFGIPYIGPVIILSFILFLTWILPITSGTLRGIKKFSILGFANISNASFKLILGILFVMFGFGVSGALMGVVFGMIISLIISFIFIMPYIRPNNPHEPDFKFKNFYFYSLPVMFAMFSLSVPTNMDVVIVKYFFSSIETGIYTSVSVLGKMIFFFPSAIYAVMFPMVTEKYTRGEDTVNIFKKGILYTAILSGALTLIYILFPGYIIKIFGSNYSSAIHLIVPYGVTMFFFSLITIIVNYHLAIKNMIYIILFTGFTFLEILLLLFFHSSMSEIVDILFISNTIFLILSILYTWRWCSTIKLCPSG